MKTIHRKGTGKTKVIRVPYEYQEQEALVELLDWANIWYYHIPNGEMRTKRTAAKLKKMGVQAGVLDLHIVTPPPARPDARGVYVEMKRSSGGSLSTNQKKWKEYLESIGYICIVPKGCDAAVKALRELGYRI